MAGERARMETAIRLLLDSNPDEALHRWVGETLHAFKLRLSGIDDPVERDQAGMAALMLIKTTLQQWSTHPPVRH